VAACRQITQPHWTPLAVTFVHACPPITSEHERFFGCPIYFASTKNAVTIRKSDMELFNPKSDPMLLQILLELAETALARIATPSDLTQNVQTLVASRLEGGPPKLRDTARELGLSARTLQRRLSDEGRTYREVVEAVRRNLAITLLTATAHTPTDVAYMTGYSELPAFQTAFRRWTGKTPRQYRQNRAT
jgi:AraC-like DNA-binding protein